jgi:hypothetical protein
MSCEHAVADNLRRWRQSGEPRRWVAAHHGQWHHDDWLGLLAALERSEFWPLEPAAVGRTLEEGWRHWANLRRWEQSGWPRCWVDQQRGEWGPGDCQALLQALQASEFWPLDPEGVEELLWHLTAQWWNVRRWRASGQPRWWVEERRGHWEHHDWLGLLDTLQRSPFWPMDPGAVGTVLEESKQYYWNLRRWQDSGEPRRWVEARQGRWSHDDWLGLLARLRQSEYAPLDEASVTAVVEEARTRYWNLWLWGQSGQARRWVEEHQGRWDHDDWLGLQETLRLAGYWPMEPDALADLLRDLKREWWNLHRWRHSGLARRWVEARQGRWGADEWLLLLAELQSSAWWPIDPDAVRQALTEARTQWWNLRRWQQSGGPRRWLEAHPAGWTAADGRKLLETLRQSEFWPLEPEAVRELIEGMPRGVRQAA